MRFFSANYFSWKTDAPRKRIKGLNNPYYSKVTVLKKAMPMWDRFFSSNINKRTRDWDDLDEITDTLRKYYAWAVPDSRALNILGEFSPLVEIGAGNGYWARLLENRGVDIIPFDKYFKPRNTWTTVFYGGPEVLAHSLLSDCNLFLCYPDEQESIAYECLENFTGMYFKSK